MRSCEAGAYLGAEVEATVLDNVVLKDLLGKEVVTPAAERRAVAHLMELLHGVAPELKRRCGASPDS